MSRATFTSVFSVAGASVMASSAHASEMPRPVLVATAATGTAVAAPCRKVRRLYLLLRSTSLIGVLPDVLFSMQSTEAAAFLDHLDLVSVGVGDEEETRQCLAVMLEIAQRSRRQLFPLEARVLRVDVVDDHGEMAVTVAKRVGLLAVEID